MIDRVCDTIGKRLQKCRNNKHMTQEQLVTLLGITQDYYSKLENDKLMMSYDILDKLYHIGWDIDYIVTGQETEEKEISLQKTMASYTEIFENRKSLRFWLYFMETRIHKGVLSPDDYLYHEVLALMKIDNLDSPNYLYAIRTTHHISQIDMAEKFKMNIKTYMKLEHGKTKPDAGVLLNLYEWNYCQPSFFFDIRRHMYYILGYLLMEMDDGKGLQGKEVLEHAKKLMELL